MRRALPALAAAFVALAAAATALPARAAVDRVVTGVWWRAQSDGGTLSAPPQVSAKQLWVSSDPSGPSAISAIHVDIGATDVASSLTLHVASLTAPPATPAAPMETPVLVCSTTGAWTAVDAATPGAWNARPKYDCAKGQVQGSLSADLKTFVFDLASIAVPGVAVDLAIVPGQTTSPVPPPPVPVPAPPPGTPASGNASPTFDVTFAPPTPADVGVAVGPDAAAPENSDVSSALSGSVGDSPAFTPTPFVDTPASQGPSLAAPLGATAGTRQPLGPSVVNLARPSLRTASLAADASKGTRVLTGLVFAALMAWAWLQLTVESRTATGPATARRPRLSLYDVPTAPATRATAHHFARAPRTGRPPPLR